ncbi:hypothetical protein CHARACLAT_029108 [Characodon lateralis]|uniref:Secreted protein n=1 Tax=Characodon lateralis TaxID=208331 RepID=A0ABU7F7C1_9TELE|nr:hypothetical protein [Characodon lateralis]
MAFVLLPVSCWGRTCGEIHVGVQGGWEVYAVEITIHWGVGTVLFWDSSGLEARLEGPLLLFVAPSLDRGLGRGRSGLMLGWGPPPGCGGWLPFWGIGTWTWEYRVYRSFSKY